MGAADSRPEADGPARTYVSTDPDALPSLEDVEKSLTNHPHLEGDKVFWRMLPKPDEARKHYIDEGTLDNDCTMEHVEFRALLDDPIAQRLLSTHVKENHLLEEFMCWIDCIEYRSIKTECYRCSKALHMYSKYIDKTAIVALTKEIIDGANIDREELYNTIMQSNNNDLLPLSTDLFDKLRDVCFRSMYDNFFIAFKSTTEYGTISKALKRRYNYVQESDFEYIKKLGHGTYGIVVHCRKKSTGIEYAMKIQLKESMLKSFSDDPKRVGNEKRAAAACNHPFIIGLHYAFQTETLACMVLELGTWGDLNDAIKDAPNNRLDEDRVQFYCAELVSALSHMHSMGLIYRDLKPGNVLLNRDGHVKLVDMGAVADVDGETLSHSMKSPKHPLFSNSRSFVGLSEVKHIRSTSKTAVGPNGMADFAAKVALMQSEHERLEKLDEKKNNSPIHSKQGSMSFNSLRRSIIGALSGGGSSPPSRNVSAQDEVSNHSRRAKSIIGTFGYMAPEMVVILSQYSHEVVGYSFAVDYWSLGVCAYKLLVGTRPFDEHSMTRLIAQAPAHHGTYEFSKKYAILFQEVDFKGVGVSNECTDFVKSLLDTDGATRLGTGKNGVKNIKEHPFFDTIDWNKLEQKLIEPPYLPYAEHMENVAKYTSFEDMLTMLNRQKWLNVIPEEASQTYFEDWNYTSSRTLIAECNLTKDIHDINNTLRVKFSSKKLSMGLSMANHYLPGGIGAIVNQQNKNKRPQRFSVLATIPSVSNIPSTMSRMLSTTFGRSTLNLNISGKASSRTSNSDEDSEMQMSRKTDIRPLGKSTFMQSIRNMVSSKNRTYVAPDK